MVRVTVDGKKREVGKAEARRIWGEIISGRRKGSMEIKLEKREEKRALKIAKKREINWLLSFLNEDIDTLLEDERTELSREVCNYINPWMPQGEKDIAKNRLKKIQEEAQAIVTEAFHAAGV